MEASVGLCARCGFASVVPSAKGSRFWRCRRADSDPGFPRYPALPVLSCSGFEEGGKLAPGVDPPPGLPARERERGER